MDIRQLKQFVVLAEELSFRRAAERLHMTQPPLSVALQRLEQEVGVKLLERSRRKVALTDAGLIFLSEARRTLAQLERSVQMAKAASEGATPVLRVGSIEAATITLLAPALAKYRHIHPDVRVMVRTNSGHELLRALQADVIDVALLARPAQADGIRFEALRREHLSAMVPKEHPLASRSRISLADLRSEELVTLFPDADAPEFSVAMKAALGRLHSSGRVYHADSRVFSKLALVAAGHGIAIVPRSLQNLRVSGVAFVDLQDDQQHAGIELGVAIKPGSSRLATEFLDCVTACARLGQP